MKKKKVVSLLMATAVTFTMLATAGCGDKKSADSDNTFSWWITMSDGKGVYYADYEDNPSVQWLNQQYWNVDEGTLGTKENGEPLKFTFQLPISGSEADNFNVMISTGEYTDIIDLVYASDSAEMLVDDGVLMDLTPYVEKYMPNYVKLLEENPDIKNRVATVDKDGKTHYYQLAQINDGNGNAWNGYVYRRDWVVKYAQPTQYVWDWDSEYVKENGHPAVTPMKKAVESGNLEGWKENELYGQKFTKNDGDDPKNTYTDNVIFPSGRDYPYTISDWEWMFEAFQKALEERGFTDDSNAYVTSVYYPGYFQMGDLVSSFGGGTGSFYVDKDGKASYSGISEGFKTYLECVSGWYQKGWLDKAFETRSSDMFFSINTNGYTQGKVGLWNSEIGLLGDTIRVTCTDEEDKKDAFVAPCPFPINDTYGSDAQKFVTPDAFYQGSRIAGLTGITTKAEEKGEDALAALFTYLNWTYTQEGGALALLGLSEEQYESAEFDPDVYAAQNLKGSYTIEDVNGVKTYKTQSTTTDLGPAMALVRTVVGLKLTGNTGEYEIDDGASKVERDSRKLYAMYSNTGTATDYQKQMNAEDMKTYTDIYTPVNDYIMQNTPRLIKEGVDANWDKYVSDLKAMGVDDAAKVLQKYVDQMNGN